MTGTTGRRSAPPQARPEPARPRMDAGRELSVTTAFVDIANSLAVGYDVVDLYIGLTADCARILDIASAGLLLADRQGVLQVVGASTERTRDLELFVLQGAEGPCLDCYRTGVAVSVPDLAAAATRWPSFAPVAVAAGFASVHAVPMRLRDATIGVLGLFGTRVGALSEEDLSLARALADVASVALVTGRAAEDRTTLAEQLQAAMDSRVLIEQAKGLLAHAGGLEIDQAFAALRSYSRDHNLKLTDVAHALVSRQLLPEQILRSRQIQPCGRRSAKDGRAHSAPIGDGSRRSGPRPAASTASGPATALVVCPDHCRVEPSPPGGNARRRRLDRRANR